LNKTWVVLSYEINKESIIEKFCINKSKPQLDCKAKCFLKKQLETTEGQDGSKSDLKIKVETSLLPIFRIFQFLTPIILNKPIYNMENISSLPLTPIQEIFHPPLI
jgi:hypothetical protein